MNAKNLGSMARQCCSKVLAPLLVLSVVQLASLEAATSWIASGTGNWLAPGNWAAGVPNSLQEAEINNGGTAQVFDSSAAASFVRLGKNSVNSGAVEILGGTLAVHALRVGENGAGTVTINGGGRVLNLGRISDSYLAIGPQSHGRVDVDGADSLWSVSVDLYVGYEGEAELNMTGRSNAVNGNAILGALPNGRGTVRVDNSTWTNTGVLAVGVQGAGSLTIANHGIVTSTNGRIGREANSNGAVVIGGGFSEWHCTGALTIGTNGGTGMLEILPGGYARADGGVTVGAGGTVRGKGDLIGDVFNTGKLEPDGLLILGNYQQSLGGKLKVALDGPNTFAKLSVVGNLTLDPGAFAGSLEVSLSNGYVPYGTKQFDILDWTGTRSGQFASVILPSLGGLLSWNTTKLYTEGILSVTGPAWAADFDENAVVNRADFTKWAAGFGTAAGALHANGDADGDQDVDGMDFLIWQRQVGSGAGTSTSATRVPEATCPLAALAAVVSVCLAHCQLRISQAMPGNRCGMRR